MFYHVAFPMFYPCLPMFTHFFHGKHLVFPMEITWMICPPSQRGAATQDLFEFSNGLQWIFFGSEAGLHHRKWSNGQSIDLDWVLTHPS